IGSLAPEVLWDRETPWWQHPDTDASRFAAYGEMMPEAEFYGLLRFVDEFDLVWLEQTFLDAVRERLKQHPLFPAEELSRLGAGNLAKAMAELCGCANSTGGDLKAFCCGPIHSVVIAAGLVQSGVFENVLVVGGGALAKLGMKFRGHLAHGMPILEDVLASF